MKKLGLIERGSWIIFRFAFGAVLLWCLHRAVDVWMFRAETERGRIGLEAAGAVHCEQARN
jgi:hypothetical protein